MIANKSIDLEFLKSGSNKMNVIPIALALISVSTIARAENTRIFNYIERSKNSNIIFQVVCRRTGSQRGTCNVKTATIHASKTEAKLFACSILTRDLFKEIPVKVSSNGNVFTYTATGGVCQVTNSYEFSAQGMKQLKLVPLTAPREFCTPGNKEYFAEAIESAPGAISVFKGLPFDGCSTIDVIIDGE